MEKPERNGLMRGQVIASIVVGMVTVFGSCGALFYQIANIAIQSNAHAEKIEALNTRLNLLVDQQKTLSFESTVQKEALNEIETQFCASDIVRNLMHASDMRTQAMLWSKSFGTTIPTDNAYYPVICNRKAAK